MKLSLITPVLIAILIPIQALGTPEKQADRAKLIASKVQRSDVWTDDDGNVTGLILINHQALTDSVGKRPGVDDSDLLGLERFSRLTALNLEAQRVTEKGLAVLKRFPAMKQVGFHYMNKAWKGTDTSIDPNFITVIDGMRDLEILEIKHNFRVKSIAIDKLKGPFPKVWRLVLDTPVTAEQTLHLASLCPNVTDLQLHRSSLTPRQLEKLGTLLPKLKVLWWKPRKALLPGHLAALKKFPKLEIFSPQTQTQLQYEGGWNHLLDVPSLKRLETWCPTVGENGEAFKRLKAKRPALEIDRKLTRSRNYDGL